MQTMTDLFRASRRAGVPLLAVETPDPAAAVAELVKALNGKREELAVIQWDIIRGPQGITEPGKDWIANAAGAADPRAVFGNPVEFLAALGNGTLPESALVFMLGANRIFGELPPVQAVWNLRDTLKPTGAQVCLVGPLGWKLPAELAGDVLTITHALPTEQELAGALEALIDDAQLAAKVDKDTRARAVESLAGLSTFTAEQTAALSLSKTGLDLPGLWERKCRTIEQTPGLSVWRGGETFAEIGGCQNVKSFLARIIAGARRPRVILFLDEIEKALGGSTGDSSGVSQGFLGTFLSWTQDHGATGMIFLGPAGSGKSAIAKATGAEAGIPTISFDLSGMKASLVGESEARLRAALATVDAVGQGSCLVVATCNSIGVLPPELRRRFALGTFFFDLPTADERAKIWEIFRAKYGRTDAPPQDDGWTGAEIRQCCDVADRTGLSLQEAAAYVIPISRSAGDMVDELRRQASGRFLSASVPGTYRFEPKATAPAAGRKMEI